MYVYFRDELKREAELSTITGFNMCMHFSAKHSCYDETEVNIPKSYLGTW